VFRSYHDEALQLVDCLRAADQDGLPGNENLPQRLTKPPRPRLGLLLAGQRGAGSADSVDPIAFGPACAFAAADLYHVFTCFGEHGGQPGGEAAGALQRPHPATRCLPGSPFEQPGVAVRIGPIAAMTAHRSGGGVHHGQVDAVSVWVASDDVLVLLCQHDHCGCPPRVDDRGRHRPGSRSPVAAAL